MNAVVFLSLSVGSYFLLFYPTFRPAETFSRGSAFQFTRDIAPEINERDAFIPVCIYSVGSGCWMHKHAVRMVEEDIERKLSLNVTRPVYSLLTRLNKNEEIGRIFFMVTSRIPIEKIKASFSKQIYKSTATDVVFLLTGDKKWEDFKKIVHFVNLETTGTLTEKERLLLEFPKLIVQMKENLQTVSVDDHIRGEIEWELNELVEALEQVPNAIFEKGAK